jgi:hypothetical protein
MSNDTSGIYAISGCAVPAEQLGDHGYYGLSIHVDVRFDQHEAALKRGKHGNTYLQNCFNLYGGSNYFLWHLVEKCDPEQLAEREVDYIKDGNTFENPKGFNLTPGGEGDAKFAAAKPFAFKDRKNETCFYGTNLVQFCKEQTKYDYQQMCRLRRGDIAVYMNLVALAIPEIGADPKQTEHGADDQLPARAETEAE